MIFLHRKMEWGHLNTPVYSNLRSDLLLVGVTHRVFRFPANAGKVKDFKAKLCKLDHLILEGEEKSHQLKSDSIGSLERSYESIAFESFKGRKHFLDSGLETDYPSLLGQYGFPPSMYGIIRTFPVIGDALEKSKGDFDQYKQSMHSYIEFGKTLLSGMSDVDTEEVIARGFIAVVTIVNELGVNGKPNIVHEVIGAFTEFMGRVRDVRIYGPRIAEMSQSLQGRKGVVMGAAHIEPLKAILEGDIPELDWKTYMAELDEDTRKGLAIVEKISSTAWSPS